MRYGSLFSGIGGIDLGLDRAGMECAWQVEQNPYCQKVLEKHWPNVPRLTDVRDVDRNTVEPVDLICGGFPCQDVSVAGKRKGLAGERSGLWFEFLRIIRSLRPRYVLVENVPGLLTSNGGRDFGTVLGGLAESGYDAEWRVISAARRGAPHRRQRLFVVSYPNNIRHKTRVFESQTLDKTPKLGSEWNEHIARVYHTRTGAWGWSPKQLFCGVAAWISKMLDRNRALGNAVVPQVSEVIGRLIIEHDERM